LTGLPLPVHLQGQSFVPLLKQPNSKGKLAAIGRFTNGDTIRTDQYRFTEYTQPNGKPVATMLYNHQQDPNENVNVAEAPEYSKAATELKEELHGGMGKPKIPGKKVN
jgi:arylsulfatase A-like enzyme